MNQDVTDYIQKLSQPWQAEVCNQIRQVIYQAIPEVAERIQYGKPHYLKNGKYACVLSAAKAGVSLTIFNAADLTAPEGVFETGGSPERKTIKFREGQVVDSALLAALIGQASSAV
jgi:hypothetical protein